MEALNGQRNTSGVDVAKSLETILGLRGEVEVVTFAFGPVEVKGNARGLPEGESTAERKKFSVIL